VDSQVGRDWWIDSQIEVDVAGRTVRAVAGAVLVALALAGCGHAAAKPAPPPGPPPVSLGYCGSDLQVRPDVVLVVCNTDDITAMDLAWTGWGKPTAVGQGTATIDLCAYSDCANGSYTTVPIKVIVSKIVRCSAGRRAYSTLRYVFADGSPWPGIPANLNTSGYLAAPNRPLPPKNQTVSLTC
jgi:hypothetical protein